MSPLGRSGIPERSEGGPESAMRSGLLLSSPAPEQFPAVLGLLQQAGLPVRDLTDAAIGNFVVASDARGLAGAAALERHGDVGLLRSLVVAPDRRGTGVGAALVDAIERRAREAGLASLVLLTETASDWFERRGYVRAVRDQAPVAVRASSEFASVCPASAIYMHKPVR